MSKFRNDAPILGTKDSPDLLNRYSLAQQLSEIATLDKGEDCLTLSLESEWGYGKTSLINIIKNHLNKGKETPIIIEFNPWLAGSAEGLVQDFLIQFSAQLSITNTSAETTKVAKQLLSYSNLFNALKLIPGAEPWTSIIQSVFKTVGSASEKIGELKELNLIERKNEVRDALSSLNKPIVVIIDDIDRLTPNEVFQVIRLVKAVADFPRTCFILSFDPEYVSNSLEKGNIDKGNQYLDKVIQLRVPLPIIGKEDMHKLANEELAGLSENDLTKKYPEDKERLSHIYWHYTREFIKTPRELKRIFNHLRLSLSQTSGEVCFTDLYCLSILAIKTPNIYKFIKHEPSAFVGTDFTNSITFEKTEDIINSFQDKRDEVIKEYNQDKKSLQKILEELFPLICEKDYSYGSSNYDENGRVASSKRLYVAMHYQVPTGFASEEEVEKLIEGKVSRKEIIEKSIRENSIDRLFDLLNFNIHKIKEVERQSLLTDLYDSLLQSEYLISRENQLLGSFQFEPFRQLEWLTRKIIDEAINKKDLLEFIIGKKIYLPISSEIIRILMIKNGDIESSSHEFREKKWLEATEFEKIKAIWIKIALEGFTDKIIIESVFSGRIYYMLKRIDSDALKDLFKKIIAEESGIEKIAKIIGRSGTDSTGGPYVEINEKDISPLLDFDLLTKLAENELSSNKITSPYLKAIYLSITKQKPYYLNNATQAEKF